MIIKPFSFNKYSFKASFTNYSYLGVTINAQNDNGVSFSGFEKINTTTFSGKSYSFICTGYTASTGSGVVTVTATTFNATEYPEYKNTSGIISYIQGD